MQEDFAALHRITEAPVAGSSISSAKPAQSASAPVAASNKLEPFLVLARSARGPGAAALVVDQVISASGVFSFGELLDVKAIVELEHSDQYRQKWLMLHIFAYGVLSDYKEHAATLPGLSSTQLTKLKLLTLVDLASKHQSLSYSQLLPALELSSVRQLEDLIIEALYFDLINARINQERQVLEVDSVIGRDVRVGTSTSLPLGQDKTVASLLQSLKVWHDRVDFTLTELNYHIGAIKQREVERNQAELKQTDQIRKTLEEVKKSALAKDKGSRHGSQGNGSAWQNWQVSSPGAAGGGGGEDLMDVDDKTSKVTKSPGKAGNRKRSRP